MGVLTFLKIDFWTLPGSITILNCRDWVSTCESCCESGGTPGPAGHHGWSLQFPLPAVASCELREKRKKERERKNNNFPFLTCPHNNTDVRCSPITHDVTLSHTNVAWLLRLCKTLSRDESLYTSTRALSKRTSAWEQACTDKTAKYKNEWV